MSSGVGLPRLSAGNSTVRRRQHCACARVRTPRVRRTARPRARHRPSPPGLVSGPRPARRAARGDPGRPARARRVRPARHRRPPGRGGAERRVQDRSWASRASTVRTSRGNSLGGRIALEAGAGATPAASPRSQPGRLLALGAGLRVHPLAVPDVGSLSGRIGPRTDRLARSRAGRRRHVRLDHQRIRAARADRALGDFQAFSASLPALREIITPGHPVRPAAARRGPGDDRVGRTRRRPAAVSGQVAREALPRGDPPDDCPAAGTSRCRTTRRWSPRCCSPAARRCRIRTGHARGRPDLHPPLDSLG